MGSAPGGGEPGAADNIMMREVAETTGTSFSDLPGEILAHRCDEDIAMKAKEALVMELLQSTTFRREKRQKYSV